MPIRKLDHVNFITNDMSATISFYTNIIGLVHREKLAGSTNNSAYFYIPGHETSILHVSETEGYVQSARFRRIAKFPLCKSEPSTGVMDHFCLAYDINDYETMVGKLDNLEIKYENYCSCDGSVKQIWLFDPNGIRVELNFS